MRRRGVISPTACLSERAVETKETERLFMSESNDGIPTVQVKLKTDKLGNSIILKGVTPAELMFLVADNHQQAGGDPVVELVREKKKVVGEVVNRDGEGRPILDAQENPVMVKGWVDSEEENFLKISAKQERDRLARKYGSKRISKFYPGPIPTFPTSFEEARENGIGQVTPSERLLEVGG